LVVAGLGRPAPAMGSLGRPVGASLDWFWWGTVGFGGLRLPSLFFIADVWCRHGGDVRRLAGACYCCRGGALGCAGLERTL
jgi:hypothetical protein